MPYIIGSGSVQYFKEVLFIYAVHSLSDTKVLQATHTV